MKAFATLSIHILFVSLVSAHGGHGDAEEGTKLAGADYAIRHVWEFQKLALTGADSSLDGIRTPHVRNRKMSCRSVLIQVSTVILSTSKVSSNFMI